MGLAPLYGSLLIAQDLKMSKVRRPRSSQFYPKADKGSFVRKYIADNTCTRFCPQHLGQEPPSGWTRVD